jgi:hypothetical protein
MNEFGYILQKGKLGNYTEFAVKAFLFIFFCIL